MAAFCSYICKCQQISISSKNTACSKIISNTKIRTKKKKILVLIWASQVALVVKNPPAKIGDTRDMGSILESGRSPGEGNDNPFQYSCLENFISRGPWQATVHVASKSQTWLYTNTHAIITSLFGSKKILFLKSTGRKTIRPASDFLLGQPSIFIAVSHKSIDEY